MRKLIDIPEDIYIKERKTHWSALLPMGCKRQKHLVVQIKSCIFALSVQDIKTS